MSNLSVIYDNILLVTSWREIMTSQPFLKNMYILRKARIAVFADIIKILSMFIKKIFKDSKKVKGISNFDQKTIYICIS